MNQRILTENNSQKKSQFHGKLASLSMQLLKEDDNLNWGCILVDTLIFSYLCLASVKCTHLIPRQGKGKNEKGDHRLLRVVRSRGGAGVLRFSSCSNFQAGCSAFNYRRYFYPLSCNCHRALLSRHYCHALCFSFYNVGQRDSCRRQNRKEIAR